jgi:hypothetical protein
VGRTEEEGRKVEHGNALRRQIVIIRCVRQPQIKR